MSLCIAHIFEQKLAVTKAMTMAAGLEATGLGMQFSATYYWQDESILSADRIVEFNLRSP